MYDASPETRQIELDGEMHDISLEAAYWDALEEIAEREGLDLDELIGDLRHRVAQSLGARATSVREPTLKSAMYALVVSYYRSASLFGNPIERIVGLELAATIH
jgi:predicted DNA-binding ribbon-helix-helix protein